jgi:hypothetical protein
MTIFCICDSRGNGQKLNYSTENRTIKRQCGDDTQLLRVGLATVSSASANHRFLKQQIGVMMLR